MKICPKCKIQHSMSGIYCSRKCANSRQFSDEAKKKKSIATKKIWEALTEEERSKRTQILTDIASRYKPEYVKNILTSEWDTLGIQGKRYRVIIEQEGKCHKCGISHWNEERITLEYEHIDGNNSNNDRTNVIALCPNCHSQTKTWRGRKNGSTQKRIVDYLEITRLNETIRSST